MDNNSTATHYDIFISFRREDGYDNAVQLKTALESRGYIVYLDDQDLEDSPFFGGVYAIIEEASIFMAVLSHGYFGEIRNNQDWVLSHINHAIDTNRVICLINPDHLFQGMPDNTPPSILSRLHNLSLFDIGFNSGFPQSFIKLDAFVKEHTKANDDRTAPIFVSYTRSDKEIVLPFIDRLENDLNIRCWIDLEGIETGEQFEDIIIQAIDSSKVVLFMLSEKSILSPWTKREVNYAEGKKKKIIPVVVDGKGLRGWFMFHFGNVDYVDISSQEHYLKLVTNLRSWLRIDSGHEKSDSRTKAEREVDKKTISGNKLLYILLAFTLVIALGVASAVMMHRHTQSHTPPIVLEYSRVLLGKNGARVYCQVKYDSSMGDINVSADTPWLIPSLSHNGAIMIEALINTGTPRIGHVIIKSGTDSTSVEVGQWGEVSCNLCLSCGYIIDSLSDARLVCPQCSGAGSYSCSPFTD